MVRSMGITGMERDDLERTVTLNLVRVHKQSGGPNLSAKNKMVRLRLKLSSQLVLPDIKTVGVVLWPYLNIVSR